MTGPYQPVQNHAYQPPAPFAASQHPFGAPAALGSDAPIIQDLLSADPAIRAAVLCAVQAALRVSGVGAAPMGATSDSIELTSAVERFDPSDHRPRPALRSIIPSRGEMPLGNAIQEFLNSRASIGRNAASTVAEKERSLSAFESYLKRDAADGALPVKCSDLTREVVIEFTEFRRASR